MGKTYFSLGADEAPEAWRAVRSIRAAPAERLRSVLKGDRSEVFQMALEQSQQQFIAAGQIAYESRPLNLFYGLSQAGRAIAAASSNLGPQSPERQKTWLPRGGHGLKFETSVPTPDRLLVEVVRLEAGRSDTFSRVSHALNSPLDFGQAAFGALLAQIPEVYLEFRSFEFGPVALQPHGLYAHSPLVFPVRWDLEARGAPAKSGTTEELQTWIAQYPALNGLQLELMPDGTPMRSHNEDNVYVTVCSQEQLVLRGSQWMPVDSVMYRRSPVLLPKLGESDRAAHPLVVWWMLLFSLSMLSRYSPKDWGHLMSLRESRLASTLEYVLDVALDAVPNLVAEALTEMSR